MILTLTKKSSSYALLERLPKYYDYESVYCNIKEREIERERKYLHFMPYLFKIFIKFIKYILFLIRINAIIHARTCKFISKNKKENIHTHTCVQICEFVLKPHINSYFISVVEFHFLFCICYAKT